MNKELLEIQNNYLRAENKDMLEGLVRSYSLSYNFDNQGLRLFLLCCRELQMKNLLASKSKDDTIFYRDLEYANEYQSDCYDFNKISIPISVFNDYGFKKHLSNNEKINLIRKMATINFTFPTKRKVSCYNFIKKVEYDIDNDIVDVTFNEELLPLILVNNDYSYVSNKDLFQLDGKYEIGIYLKYRRFKETGKIFFNLETSKEYFLLSKNYKSFKLNQNLEKAVNSLNAKLGLQLKLTTLKQGNDNHSITEFVISFPKKSKKIKQ